MKTLRPTFFNIILSLVLLLIVVRADFLLNCIVYYSKFVYALLAGAENAVNQLDYRTVELFILSLLLVILPVLIIYYRKKLKFFHSRMNLPALFICLLFFSLIFAPLITLQHPNFQKDISVTKLLPPLSSVNYIKRVENAGSAERESLQYLKNRVVVNPFDKSIEFVDSITVKEGSIILHKFLKSEEISRTDVVSEAGKPVVSSRMYLLGTDHLGRDVFAMLVYGSRTSIMVGLSSLLIVFIIGLSFGFSAAFKGGVIDTILSRISDIFLAFPSIFLVLLVLALFGNNLFSVIFVLGFSGWMSLFRIVKGEVLIVKSKDYVVSSQLLGLSKTKILMKDIMPVIASPILVNMVIQFANIILAESTLSFLGLGVGVEYYSWGSLIQSGQEYLTKGWWMILIPGMTLVLTLFSFNSFANSLNQKFNPLLGK